MNTKFKILARFLLVNIFIVLTSCEKDLYEDAIVSQSKVTSHKVSMSQVLSEINSPIIKDYIKEKIPKSLGLSETRGSVEDYLSFIKIIKHNEYITYSILINGYSDSKPFIQYFVITKEGEIEKAGFAKYIPDNPTNIFDVRNFSGRVQILDVNNNVAAETVFINGDAQPPVNTNQNYTCYWTNLVAHNCNEGGNHPPGIPCDDGIIRSYWEVVVVNHCATVTSFTAPDTFMGQNGGGGIASLNVNVMFFLNQLSINNPDALDLLINNPELITYLEDNDATPESITFVLDCLFQIQQNPEIFTNAIPLLIEKKINDDELDQCSKGVLENIKNTNFFDIAQVIAKLDNPSSVYNTIIKTANLPNGNTSPATTIRNSAFNYTIYITPNYNGKTKLFIANLLIHEIVHAYFLSIVDDYNSNPNNNQNLYNLNSFPSLFQAYCDKRYPPTQGTAQDIHHFEMANYYVDAIARALQEYQTGISVVTGTNPDQIYSDLAWAGLNGTPVFDATYPIGNPNRERILNRGACEQTGVPIGQGNVNQQNPIGLPCN